MRSFFTLLLVALVSLELAPLNAQAAGERQRTFWRGQWVDYVEVGDYAITEGDIIIGRKDEVRAWREAFERGQQKMAETLKALSVDRQDKLWNIRDASGVVLVPYTIEAGNRTYIQEAITRVNQALSGVLRMVPRGSEPDYIAFNLHAVNSGSCLSHVGRRGGRQEIFGEPDCPAAILVHEIGHALGLLHTQQDARSSAYVDWRSSLMDPARRPASSPQFFTRTFGGYDYTSTMHYRRAEFPISLVNRVTLETKPAGIDVFGEGLSPADIDALRRLYSHAPTRTTIYTNPSGLRVVINGTSYATPVSFDWPIGSVQRLWVEPGLQVKDGFRFAFGRWSHDPSEKPSTQLTWQVLPGDGQLGSPRDRPAETVIVANFIRLIEVQTTPEVQAGGRSIVRTASSPWPGTTSLFPQFTAIFDLNAESNPGFEHFFTWGDAFASRGGAGVRRQVTLLATGNVPTQTIGAGFHRGPAIAVDVQGAGTEDGILVQVSPPGSSTRSMIAPLLSRTTPGNWRFQMTSPQLVGSAIRHVLEGLEGFDDPSTGTVAMPASGTRTVTIRARREVTPFRQVIPSCAGSIMLSDTASWLRTGQSLTIQLNPSGAGLFTGWSGTLSGTALSHTIQVGREVPEFVARFNTIAEPLTLTSLSPSVIGDDGSALEAMLTGTGFTAATRVFVNGVEVPKTFLDSRRLRITLSRPLLGGVGRVPVFVQNALSTSCAVSSNSVALDILPVGQRANTVMTEYYHAGFDYYFITGREADKSVLDRLSDWRRTGVSFRLAAVGTEQTLPLERFFFPDVARNGARGSHFYTAVADEKTLLTSLNPGNASQRAKPVLESIEGHVFPKRSDGSCAEGLIPVYRAFKGPPRYVDDGNHRYSISLAQHRDMVERLGWADEGVAFCAQP